MQEFYNLVDRRAQNQTHTYTLYQPALTPAFLTLSVPNVCAFCSQEKLES